MTAKSTFVIRVFLQAEGHGSGRQYTSRRYTCPAGSSTCSPALTSAALPALLPVLVVVAPSVGQSRPGAAAVLKVGQPPRGEVVVLHRWVHTGTSWLLSQNSPSGHPGGGHDGVTVGLRRGLADALACSTVGAGLEHAAAR